MDFRFNDEQRIWHDTMHSFMEKEVGREYTRAHDNDRAFPYEIYKKMAVNGIHVMPAIVVAEYSLMVSYDDAKMTV